MKIKIHKTFVLLEGDHKKLNVFISEIETNSNIKDKNIVIDLLSRTSFLLGDLLLFLNISNLIRGNNHSFVIINNAMDPDDIPDEFIVVPTLQEAEDIIEMEEIERELGF